MPPSAYHFRPVATGDLPLLRQWLDRPRVVTDPNPRNARALRAYAKAGFQPIDHRVTISGDAVLMGCDARTMSE
jgi:RimJ/RimL family protein N-acetyltransferase